MSSHTEERTDMHLKHPVDSWRDLQERERKREKERERERAICVCLFITVLIPQNGDDILGSKSNLASGPD